MISYFHWMLLSFSFNFSESFFWYSFDETFSASPQTWSSGSKIVFIPSTSTVIKWETHPSNWIIVESSLICFTQSPVCWGQTPVGAAIAKISNSLVRLGGWGAIMDRNKLGAVIMQWILTGVLAFFQGFEVVHVAQAPAVYEALTLLWLVVIKIPREVGSTDPNLFFQKAEIWLFFLQCCLCLSRPLWIISYTFFFALLQTFKLIFISFTSPIYKFFTLSSENIEKKFLQHCSAWAFIRFICTVWMCKSQWW